VRHVKGEVGARHGRLKKRLEAEGLDAIVAYSNAKFQGCVQYVANYSVRFVALNTLPDGTYVAAGSCAALLAAGDDEGLLVVDQRWDTSRAESVSTLPRVAYSYEMGVELGKLIAERGYARVGVDNWFVFPAPHYLALKEAAPDVEFVPTQLIEDTYKVKSAAEVDLIRAAQQVGVRALAAAFEQVAVGASDHAIALAADRTMREHGDLELAGGMAIAAGPDTAIGSGVPSRTDPYVLQRGDWVMVDVCPQYEGYAGDICRMFVAGSLDDVDPFRRRLYDATRTMLEESIAAIRPGVTPAALNRRAEQVATEQGVAEYKTTTLGHGVGIDLHDAPDFRWDEQPLEPGVCITIEPCLMVPGVAGTRIEELVVVTDDGCEVLGDSLSTELRGSEE
jgi:Xaa-Pro aminopeptidase